MTKTGQDEAVEKDTPDPSTIPGILPDNAIAELCRRDPPMIEPFSHRTRVGAATHGLGPYGYDVRLGTRFKFYANLPGTIDPEDFREEELVEISCAPGDFIDLPPHSSVLAHTEEYVSLPRDVTALVADKSTYARCFVALQNTVLEAGWAGQITLEITNHNRRAVRLRPGCGIAQLLFLRGSPCDAAYDVLGGRYQGQTGVTPPAGAAVI